MKTLLWHKWVVFLECCRLGIPFRGILHDLSMLSEYGLSKEIAFFIHTKRNKHHWQYWVHPYRESVGEWASDLAEENSSYPIYRNGSRVGVIGGGVSTYETAERISRKDVAQIIDILNGGCRARVLQIPNHYIKEMVADWKAHALEEGITLKEYYNNNRHKILLHPISRKKVHSFIK